MRVLITGDRFWACHQLADGVLQRIIARHGPDITIVRVGSPPAARFGLIA